ncbi:MAG: alpha-amylase family glycosyl hydrolase [Phycisphaerales bacterium]
MTDINPSAAKLPHDRTSGRPWTATEVIYQIFPDRFRRGSNAPRVQSDARHWRGEPVRVTDDRSRLTDPKLHQNHFYGGDLEGIAGALPYLSDLGVTAIYLNPIFAANTTHRYDTTDYQRIDPMLGDRRDFEALVQAMRRHEMMLVLDGVFNHTSSDHPWYHEVESRRSRYIMKPDGEAMSWQNSGHLPKLDLQNEEVVASILKVIDAWPEADAWRLDAGHLIPRATLRRIREHAAPRRIIVEDWNYAQHYDERHLADGVTNYAFREYLRCFFTEDCSPETLFDRMRLWIDGYPRDFLRRSWNYLENHDLTRFRREVGRERLMRALVMKFTTPGTPMLFQGIETGLEGGPGDTHTRAPFDWDESTWDRELLDHVRSLIALRRDHPVLATGEFKPLYADNRTRTLAYEMRDERRGERAVIALNDGYRSASIELNGDPGRIDLDAGAWRVSFHHD